MVESDRSAERSYFPNCSVHSVQGSDEAHVLNQNLDDVSPSPEQHRFHQRGSYVTPNHLTSERRNYSQRTPFLEVSSVTTIQPVRSSQYSNLHHRVGGNSFLQNADTIDLSICGPVSSPFVHNQRGSRNQPQGVRKMNDFFKILSIDREKSKNCSWDRFEKSFSSSSVSSLGSSDSADEPSFASLVDHFKLNGSNRFPVQGSGGIDMSSCYTCVESYPNEKQQHTKEFSHGSLLDLCAMKSRKRNREFQAQTMHQERRRIRQLVFFAASFLISIIFLFGVLMTNVERIRFHEKLFHEHTEVSVPLFDAPERDTLIMYRIIGNDLPPRHSPRQTLINLKFMLEHESAFEDLSSLIDSEPGSDSNDSLLRGKLRVKKFFVLNRIANQTQLSLVENLLKSYGISDDKILSIPFVSDIYRSKPFNLLPRNHRDEGLYMAIGPEGNLKDSAIIESVDKAEEQYSTENGSGVRKLTNVDRWKALDFTYHSKNLYVMNNNGGRNFALEHGRSIPEARWILPLDGNCFFTPAALESVILSLRESDSQPDPPSHVIIPMSRLTDNQQALDQNAPIKHERLKKNSGVFQGGRRPRAPHEPQIGFRFTSKETYAAEMRYGRRSKLELLWRLGAIDRSRSLDKKTNDWEVYERNILTAKSYGTIQRRLRSPSPTNHQIVMKHGSSTNHFHSEPDFIRAGWVFRLFSGHRSQEEYSERGKSLRSNSRIKGIITFLEGIDEAIARDSINCRINQLDEACGFTDWRLWSLDGEELEKIKRLYKKKDSSAIQLVENLVQLSEPVVKYASSMIHRGEKDLVKNMDLSAVPNTIFILALTAYLADNEQYADIAASLVNMIFLQPNHFSSTPDAFEVTLNTHLQSLRLQIDYDGFGYAFPMLRHDQSLPRWMKNTNLTYLPFNPYTFDPSLLLDGIRLLSNDWKTAGEKYQSEGLQKSLSEKLPREQLKNLFTLQMSYLLLNESMVQEFFTQDAGELEKLNYLLKLSALASFTDDVKLLNRILNRTPIELSLSTSNGILDSSLSEKKGLANGINSGALTKLYQRFRSGFHNRRLQRSGIPLNPIHIIDHFETFRETLGLLSRD